MTRPVPIDQPVRDRVIAGIERSCLVEASAGTGKTSLMVERIRTIVETGAARLDQVAAITFTEKAAGELRFRLRQRLTARLAEPGLDAAGAVRLADAVLLLDRATVSTIHSFCTQLLRERPIEAGVTPGFGVADQVQAGILRDEVWDAWLATELARDSSPLEAALESGASLDGLRDLAVEMIRQRDLLSDLDAVLPAAAAGSAEDPEAAWEAFRGAVQDLEQRIDGLLALCRAPGEDLAHRTMSGARAELRDLARNLADAERPRYRALVPVTLPRIGNKGSKKNWSGDALAELRAARDAIRDAATAWASAFRADCTRRAVLGLLPFLEAYEAAKSDRNLLDFEDLLLRARDLVRDHPDVRRALRDTYSHLLVDEFQDTDPLQAEVVCSLADARDADGPWEEARIGPGRLFLVGDPKQSIYRFRRADIEMYDRAARILEASGGAREVIETNFRTRPAITRWVNDTFVRLMPPDEADAAHPPYSPIAAFRGEPEGDRPGVVRLDVSGGEGGEGAKAAARRREEARAVAAFLSGPVRDWPVFDRHGAGGWRPAGPGDVAILFRAFTALPLYEEVFRAAGVPYRVDGGKYYFQRLEVQALLSVLRAVDNPLDRTALVAALRGPLFGFSNDDLFRAAEEGALDAAGSAAPSNPALADARAAFRDWHRRRHVDGPSRIVEEVLVATRAVEFFSLTPIGEQRVANLLKILDEARRFEREPGAFRAFIRYLSDREAELQAEAESPVVEEETGGVVQLLSVHKAKGLEFPVVVLADLAGGGVSGREASLVDRSGPDGPRVGFQLKGLTGTGYTPGWEALKAREKIQADAEAIRLFYVAATRARDLLVLPAAPGAKRAVGFHALLGDAALAELPVVPIDTRGVPDEVPAFRDPRDFPAAGEIAGAVADIGAVRREFEEIRARRATAWPRAIPWVTPSGEVESRDAASDADAPESHGAALEPDAPGSGARIDRDALPTGAPPPGAGADEIRAAARRVGRAVHRTLETVAADGADLAERVEAAALLEGLRSGDERTRAERLARAALRHPVWTRAHASQRALREVPFFRRLESGVVLDGVCDLVFEEDGELVVVDWKTDRSDGAPLPDRAARHRRQLLGYALGLEGLAPLPVRELLLVFLDDGATEVVTAGPEFLSEARRAFAVSEG
jgi:ATP-dependent helicase/nuclease subunit A